MFVLQYYFDVSVVDRGGSCVFMTFMYDKNHIKIATDIY